MSYTKEQERAIMCEKGDILVSASAGSGKTFVMIQRLINLIITGRAKIGEILAVTFTNLAAAEMKEKLIRALTDKINLPETPKDVKERLKAEISDVSTASVSTFHSFCNDLIKNYFYMLGLDASFRIADETQAGILKKKAMDKLFEDKYSSRDSEFKYLLSLFLRNRSDRFLKNTTLELYEFFITEAYPERFAENALNLYSEEGYNRVEAAFFSHYRAFFGKIATDFKDIKNQLGGMGEEKSAKVSEVFLSFACELSAAENLTELVRRAQFALFPRLPVFKAEDEYSLSVKNRLHALKDRLVKEAKYLKATFSDKPIEEAKKDLCCMRDAAEALVGLCFDFGREYSAMKREENLVDFADLEHFALELLDDPETAKAVSSRYKYVFADEYQDTNGVQEEILTRITSFNSFMVGDVKQSIYAFRGCNPKIFLNRQARFKEGEGTCLYLTSNFRSSDAVLKGVNRIFSEIMTEETAETDYSTQLMSGGNGAKGYAEIKIALKKESEKSDKHAKRRVYSVKENLGGNEDDELFTEGILIASTIRDVLSDADILPDGSERHYSYSDIVILTRAGTSFARGIADALADNDVPVTSEVKREVTVYPETRHLICLLRVIDCFRQDIPLCAVMRGPIGGFTDEDLAAIRIFATETLSDAGVENPRRKPFFEAVQIFLERGEGELKTRLEDFCGYIEKLRFLSDYEGAQGILARVVREKNVDLYYAARPDGKNRVRRINKLIAESAGKDRPYTVREFLKRLDAGTDDISVAEAGGENAVRLMTIHASKGLEFPVVILAGIGEKFVENELRNEIIKDRQFGFALKTYRQDTMRVDTNILTELLKRRFRRVNVTEEMRLLYVALTRAQYRLYITGGNCTLPNTVSASDVMCACGFSQLIPQNSIPTTYFSDDDIRSMCVERRTRKVVAGEADEALVREIKKNLSFAYPFDTKLIAKSSVTSLLLNVPQDEPTPPVPVLFGDEARETGDAYHRFMELVDFEKPSISQIIAQKERFVKEGAISAEWAEMIDPEKVSEILNNGFFHIAGARYFRELPFEVLMPSDMAVGGGGTEPVLVQGVIDVLCFTPDGLLLADYKVSGRTAEGLYKHYKRQLDMYSYAAEKITGQKVLSETLFNLRSGEKIEL